MAYRANRLFLPVDQTRQSHPLHAVAQRWSDWSQRDDCVDINSNNLERSIRPIALNRNNAPFAGSDTRSDHWATVVSLVETAKLS
ncbi:IS66 family transposase [Agrobacterium tumefaciens]|uniref:IS66 family transposase n=1 Tax=Agrobacterium tumefaciens TaxID=358 RepID=UPI001319F865|nr:transposase [Agrobacterium tumefaciens]NSY99301.1 transposase [Agrobacterium tumefaciens]